MRTLHVAPLLLVLAGCAVRLGGARQVEYETVAIQFDQGTSVSAAAARLRELNTKLALVVTQQDSTWVRQLAEETQLVSSRPGRAGDYTLAFLAFKPEADTTLTLAVQGGGGIRLHDALYNVDKARQLDLMTVVFQPGTGAREGTRALLNYIATDVMGSAAVALAVHAPTAVTDSVAELTRAAMTDAWECTMAGKNSQNPPAMSMRLFFFPAARIRCESARVEDTANRPIVARLIVP